MAASVAGTFAGRTAWCVDIAEFAYTVIGSPRAPTTTAATASACGAASIAASSTSASPGSHHAALTRALAQARVPPLDALDRPGCAAAAPHGPRRTVPGQPRTGDPARQAPTIAAYTLDARESLRRPSRQHVRDHSRYADRVTRG